MAAVARQPLPEVAAGVNGADAVEPSDITADLLPQFLPLCVEGSPRPFLPDLRLVPADGFLRLGDRSRGVPWPALPFLEVPQTRLKVERSFSGFTTWNKLNGGRQRQWARDRSTERSATARSEQSFSIRGNWCMVVWRPCSRLP